MKKSEIKKVAKLIQATLNDDGELKQQFEELAQSHYDYVFNPSTWKGDGLLNIEKAEQDAKKVEEKLRMTMLKGEVLDLADRVLKKGKFSANEKGWEIWTEAYCGGVKCAFCSNIDSVETMLSAFAVFYHMAKKSVEAIDKLYNMICVK